MTLAVINKICQRVNFFVPFTVVRCLHEDRQGLAHNPASIMTDSVDFHTEPCMETEPECSTG